MRVNHIVLVLLLGLLATNCGKKNKPTLSERLLQGEVTADEVFAEAERLMQKRKYIEARRWYRVIETSAPNSEYFSRAKLGIADSYFFDRTSTYIEASVEYKSFLTHFPTHTKADYAEYQHAMCFFTEIESADRDQTSTWSAYTHFKNLIDKFPASPYVPKAREKLELCLLRLADHEFTVGYYYFRRGKGFEKSAEQRFKYIIDNYEGQFDPLRTYFYMAETLWRLQKYAEAMKYYEYLNRKFPDSEFQPFVEDKLVRYVKLSEEGVDPGDLSGFLPPDDADDPLGN